MSVSFTCSQHSLSRQPTPICRCRPTPPHASRPPVPRLTAPTGRLLRADISCERPLPAHQASLLPGEFILRPGDSRRVSAVTPPVTHAQDVGAVLVLSGDETLRQELRRRPPGAPPSLHTPANLRTVNFQVRQGERGRCALL